MGEAGRGSRRRTVRRRSLVVRHEGQTYERDLAKCRRLVLQRQMEREFDSVEELAGRVGLSKSTVHRWLRGVGPGATETTVRILAGLRVEFNEVHRKVRATAEVDVP
jgi:transcriptional regulator with XRE-family HTH domain